MPISDLFLACPTCKVSDLHIIHKKLFFFFLNLHSYSSKMLFCSLLFFIPFLFTSSFFHPTMADSACPLQNYTCGNITVGIQFPFYTNSSVPPCGALHFIQCIDLVPAVRFNGDSYLYPVRSISYEDKTIIIHDLKLSSYFRGWNCDFLYDFRKPIPGFNFTSISETLPSGESLFNLFLISISGASMAASLSVFIIGCILCFVQLRRRRRRNKIPKQNHSSSSTLLFYQSSNISPPFSQKDPDLARYHYQTHIFSDDELYEATNSFDPAMEVGDGGFGTVYKGKLRDGRAVAVKRLYESNYKRVEQFANEIVILSRVRHQNLVSLYGCTSPKSHELVIVYEFVPNGTLADHLHGNLAGEGRLTWPFRLSIAVETATALAYLHAIDPPIIHRDVKTGNILLDAEFHVKVADFGLSRLFPPDGSTHISTAPQGTPGYLDPEYHQCYQLTDRSDVYSFGVVLVELVSSKPAVDFSRDRLEINLSTMAVNRIQKGNFDDLMDKKLGFESNMEIKRMMKLVAELAFRCLQVDREMRPSIKEVLEVLKGIQSGPLLEHSIEQVVSNAERENRKRPSSPESVTEKWTSRSSTPNSSHRGA